MGDAFKIPVHLRKNNGLWPPLHTPILRDPLHPESCGIALRTMGAWHAIAQPAGAFAGDGQDELQRLQQPRDARALARSSSKLWDAIYEMPSVGVETLVHVGPEPNFCPRHLQRLSDNVTAQFSGTRFANPHE